MEKMRDKNGNPEKKSSRTTLIMTAGLLGILLIGIPPRWKAAWRESWGALTG